jgi:SAM-dependent methyltransferase
MSAMTDTADIDGDARQPVGLRLRYLMRNAGRNLRDFARPPFRRFANWPLPPDARGGNRAASPGRRIAEAFFVHGLPAHLPPGEISVLEIGCGSGRCRTLLAEAGYRGRYVGYDIHDRFDRHNDAGFDSRFHAADAHAIVPDASFDLVISNSALEHIRDDARLITHLRGCLRPGGIQAHIVPSGAALWAYLWHGYRQYAGGALAARFAPERTSVHALGGLGSLLVHIMWITIPEILLRAAPRTRLTGLYATCAAAGRCVDRIAGFGAPMYAVVEQAPEPAHATGTGT